jgi:hypothetical protein
MKSLEHFLVLAGCALLITGCTRTYVGRSTPSPDGTSYVSIVGHGAYSRAYVDHTKKLLDVQIKRSTGTNETVLFSHRYKFVAADMSWDARWTSPKMLTLEVYDFGPGISVYDAEKTGAPSNHIATLVFTADKKANKFVEEKQSMPAR